jgi:hypothetical protein
MRHAAERFGWSGLALGPGAWAVNTLAGYALVSALCPRHSPALLLLAGALAAVAICGASMSALSYKAHAAERDGAPRALLAGVGAGLAALLAAVVILQGSAVLLLGCEQ